MFRSATSQIGDDTSVFAGVRRLRAIVLGVALLAAVCLSVAANFVLFKSSLLAAPMRLSHGLINGTLVANFILIAIVIVLCLCVWGGARANDLGLRRRDLGPALAITLATWLFLNVLQLSAAVAAGSGVHPSHTFESAGTFGWSVGELIGQVFGNALYEELLFRGVLLVQIALWIAPRGARPSRRAFWSALLISQAVFALQHIPNRLAFDRWTDAAGIATDMAGLFASGLFLAGVFARTRNLLIAVGMHTLINTPMLLVVGPDWAHPTGVALALIALMVFGPRLGRRLTVASAQVDAAPG
jgi:membrane protease YdiL (CAAX protease family)